MFLGHFGLGLAGKKVAPALSLGLLFFAVQFADLVFWILALLGVEHVQISPGTTVVSPFDFYDYPISHSLAALTVEGPAVGGSGRVRLTYRRPSDDRLAVTLEKETGSEEFSFRREP